VFTDFRLAFRQLQKSPGFTMTVVLTLALGIGATTAIFSLVDQVMLRSLPVTKPQELWRIGKQLECCDEGGYTEDGDFSLYSWDLYQQIRGNTPEFSDLAAMQAGNRTVWRPRCVRHWEKSIPILCSTAWIRTGTYSTPILRSRT
jgi:putative ABC transport system permease protein